MAADHESGGDMDSKDSSEKYFDQWSDEQKWIFLSRHERLGEVLVKKGHLSVEQLEQLLAEQKGGSQHIGQIIIDRGLLSIDEILAALEQQYLNDKISLQAIADLKSKQKNQDQT
jgi:hypothetical protein